MWPDIVAYVYLKDGTFLNAEIFYQGYGFVYGPFPFGYMERLRKHDQEAREKKNGLWD